MVFLSRFGNMSVADEPVYKSELVSGLGYMAGLFSQTEDSTPITNTNIESTLIGVGVGQLSVPANTFKVGNAYSVRIGGFISCDNLDLIRFKIKANNGSVILADTGDISLKVSTNKVWQLAITFVIRQVGTTGVASINTHFVFSYEQNASDNFESHAFDVVNNTTFDTTIHNTLDITATWGQISANDNIYTTIMNLNKIF